MTLAALLAALTMGGLLARLGQFLTCYHYDDNHDCEYSSDGDDEYMCTDCQNRSYREKHAVDDIKPLLPNDDHAGSAVDETEAFFAHADYPTKLFRKILHIEAYDKNAMIYVCIEHMKQRASVQRIRLEAPTSVDLHPDVVRLVEELHDLYVESRRHPRRETESSAFLKTLNGPCDLDWEISTHQFLNQCGVKLNEYALDWMTEELPANKPPCNGNDHPCTDVELFKPDQGSGEDVVGICPEDQIATIDPVYQSTLSNDHNTVLDILRKSNFMFIKPTIVRATSENTGVTRKHSIISVQYRSRSKKTQWDGIIEQRLRWRINKPRMKCPVRTLTKRFLADKFDNINFDPENNFLRLSNPVKVSVNIMHPNFRYLAIVHKSQREKIKKIEKRFQEHQSRVSSKECDTKENNAVLTSTTGLSESTREHYVHASEAPELPIPDVLKVPSNPVSKRRNRISVVTSPSIVSLSKWSGVVQELDTINKFLAISLRELLIICQENVSGLKVLKATYGKDDAQVKESINKVKPLNARVQKLLQRCQHYINIFRERTEEDENVIERENTKRKLEQDVYHMTQQSKSIKDHLKNFVSEADSEKSENGTLECQVDADMFPRDQEICEINPSNSENVKSEVVGSNNRPHRMFHYRNFPTSEKDALAEYVHGHYDDFHMQGVKGMSGPKYIEVQIKQKKRNRVTQEQANLRQDVKLTKRQRKQMLKSRKNKVMQV